MNFTFPGLSPAPQFLSSDKVTEIQTDANVLNQTSQTTVSASLFQESNHNVSDYCDKSVFTTAPSHINSNNESRPPEWINMANRSSMDMEKKVYSTFAVTSSSTHQAVGMVWQPKTITQNVSTMTDWEMPENLCKSSDSKDNEVSKLSFNENDYVSHCSWNSCSKIHLQRQGNAMAVYLARLQPKSLPLSIQQFLNRHNIKLMKDDGFEKKPKINCDFKPRNSEIRVITDLDGTTMFCCPECRTAYPERERLEAHMAVHKSERRFQCNVCGACLKRKEHLDQHKRRHSEERPFVCEICHKGFKRNEHLRRHFIIHSGNKMHTCPICGKAFSRKDHLNKHAQTHVTKRIKSENGALSIMNDATD